MSKSAMQSPFLRPRALAVGVALALAALVTGCGKSSGGGTPQASSNTSITETKDATLAAEVPAPLRTKGTIAVGTDAPYAPNEFFGPDNRTLIGMDVDLGTALGQVLGLQFTFADADFKNIIPGLGTRYDLGMSSFTDNKDRENKSTW